MNSLKKNITWILILVAIMLAIGCFKLPIGYYTFLKIVVFITVILVIIANKDEGVNWINMVLALIAILFNPIFPIYLHSKIVWVFIDVTCAVWMFFCVLSLKKHCK